MESFHKLFTYGSLMCEEIMKRVVQHYHIVGEGTLHHYRRLPIRNQVYPGIIPSPGDQVKGLLYSKISIEALEEIDRFEGNMYNREEVLVQFKEGVVQASTYILKKPYDAMLGDGKWDYEHFLKEGVKEFILDEFIE